MNMRFLSCCGRLGITIEENWKQLRETKLMASAPGVPRTEAPPLEAMRASLISSCTLRLPPAPSDSCSSRLTGRALLATRRLMPAAVASSLLIMACSPSTQRVSFIRVDFAACRNRP
jgi:hypothetical protein